MLYVVMLGGRHPGAKIEVHDVVFALADTFEQAYPQLRQAWFGSPKGLHIDSWLEVHGVDGQRIELRPHAPAPGASGSVAFAPGAVRVRPLPAGEATAEAHAANTWAGTVDLMEPASGGIRLTTAEAPEIAVFCASSTAAELGIAPGGRVEFHVPENEVSVRALE